MLVTNPQAPEAFKSLMWYQISAGVLGKLKDQPSKKGKLWAVNSLDFSNEPEKASTILSHKICSRMDWLEQHNLFSTDVIEGKYRMHLSPFTSIFAPISPLPWLQISYLKNATKALSVHVFTSGYKCRYEMQQFPAEWGEKDYESYSSVSSFCQAISFQFSASVREKGNIWGPKQLSACTLFKCFNWFSLISAFSSGAE